MSSKGSGGLGKGLDALLGNTVSSGLAPKTNKAGLEQLNLDQLVPNPGQPRSIFDDSELRQLADSITANGILQPILVRPDPQGTGSYQIVAGERRWRAAQLAGYHEVPVIIRQLKDSESLEIALVENLQRHDLNPMEEARAYHKLIEDFAGTQSSVAERVGKSRSHLANTLRLLQLPDEVQEWVELGDLQAGHARAILSAEDPLSLAKVVRKKGLSVRQAEQLAKDRPGKARGQTGRDSSPDTESLERALTTVFGMKVSIKGSGQRGEVRIRYSNPAELRKIEAKVRGQW